MQAVTRALTILPCQPAPTQASGPKPGFWRLLLPPRHCGDSVAKTENDEASLLGADAPAFSLSAGVPEAAELREARYTAIGSMSLDAMSASRLAAIRRTVVRQPARSFVRSRDREASWHLVQLR